MFGSPISVIIQKAKAIPKTNKNREMQPTFNCPMSAVSKKVLSGNNLL